MKAIARHEEWAIMLRSRLQVRKHSQSKMERLPDFADQSEAAQTGW